ncbi:exosome complex protein Lrp1p [[Candida] anglica]|uniref:Exosome complex protein n=1 Tax=[Candida] anglica TaxID=148631 RepID=A0ABP0E7I1_9ASCO
MENIQNVKRFIQQLDSSTAGLAKKLHPVLSKPLDEQAAQCESPVAQIKLYNNYLYVLISVLYAYLKSIGTDTTQHPIMKELTRIKTYMARLKELEAKLSQKDTSEEDALKAKSYLQHTLGGKVNGGGAAQTSSLTTPAISSGNFGKHTKFDDKEDDEAHERALDSSEGAAKKSGKPIQKKTSPSNLPKKPTTTSKVTKPKKTKAKVVKKVVR